MTKITTASPFYDGSACCGFSGTTTEPKMSDLANNYKTTDTTVALGVTT